MKLLALTLLLSLPSFAKYDYPENGVEIPTNSTTYTKLEEGINTKFDEISEHLDKNEYSKAVQKAKAMRNKIRKILFKDPRAANETITIRVGKEIEDNDRIKIAIDYMGGYFVDVLNLYKRIEMYYTYSLVKRFTAGDKKLLPQDEKLFTDTLLKVLDNKVHIIGKESKSFFGKSTNSTFIIFESEFVDINENYLFNREVETYYRDLQISEGLDEISSQVKKQRRENEIQSCKQRVLQEFDGANTESVDTFCRAIDYQNINCAIEEIKEIKIDSLNRTCSHSYRTKYKSEYRDIREYGCSYEDDLELVQISLVNLHTNEINNYCSSINY